MKSLLVSALTLMLLGFNQLTAQSSLFTASSLTENDLTQNQAEIFDKLILYGDYTSWQFVTTDLSAFEDEEGLINLELPDFFLNRFSGSIHLPWSMKTRTTLSMLENFINHPIHPIFLVEPCFFFAMKEGQ